MADKSSVDNDLSAFIEGIQMMIGMDCFADDREALSDFAKYFNNTYLSDVTLVVGKESFPAHRIILAKNSEVFEQMLSNKWNGDKEEIELFEEAQCSTIFSTFLRFLYCNHVLLNAENALPILILSDKYNVTNLRKVCLQYTMHNILPMLSLKDLYHVWFLYATKSYHQQLIAACIETLAENFADIISAEEWEKEWLSMDRDQLTELLKSNDLSLPNEYKLWEAVQKWLQASAHPERRGNTTAPLLAGIISLIRFPFMTPIELNQLERSPFVEQYPKLFLPQILQAYKFQALPLFIRVGCKDFTGTQYLLRNYTDVRWDKRFTIFNLPIVDKYTEFIFKHNDFLLTHFQLQSRSSSFPIQCWDWELKVYPKGFSSSNEEFRCSLSSNVIVDQNRCVEYLMAVVDDKRVIRCMTGKKNFTKTRYCSDLEMNKRVGVEEFLSDESPLLVNGNLHLQLTLRPID